MAFPINEFEALIAAAKATVVDITEVIKNGAVIFAWAKSSLGLFSGPGGMKAVPVSDPIAECQKLVDLHKSGKTTAGMALGIDWLSAVMALIQLLIDKWLHPKP